jgi:hypothetical protein
VRITPLSLHPLLSDGSFGTSPTPAPPANVNPANIAGRLGCIPFGIAQCPGNEVWKIDAIHMNNWGDRDAIYSLTIEAPNYNRNAVIAAAPGLRYESIGSYTGRSTIRWGKFLPAGDDQPLRGPWFVMPNEWLAGAAILGLGTGMVNCYVAGWILS